MEVLLQTGNDTVIGVELPRYAIVESCFKYGKKRIFFLLECHTLPEKMIVFYAGDWMNSREFTKDEVKFIIEYFEYGN